MPELPEIEVYRRRLTEWVVGSTVTEVRVVDRAVVRRGLSSKPSDALPDAEERLQVLVGKTAGEVLRHGKRMGWLFGDKALIAHFGMTGGFVRRSVSDPQPSSSKVGLVFGDTVIWYTDDRRMGCVNPIDPADLQEELRSGVGPDALDEPLDGPALKRAVSCKKPIKVALMEQDRVAGIGNIHASEACYRAHVSPKTAANRLTDGDWDALSRGLVEQLSWTVDQEMQSGEHFYVNKGGTNFFSVYQKTGEGCPSCGTPIVSEDLGGRGTYWCPSCQPER